MDTTRISLLLRIRDHDDTDSWREFYDLYSPLLYRYARARGLNRDEAEEIRSSCLETLVTHLRDFDYVKEKGGFRAWLRRIVLNRIIDLQRRNRMHQFKSGEVEQIQCDEKTADELFEEQWKHSHLEFCLEKVKTIVPKNTFRAFEMLAENATVAEISDQLDLNANQIYKAKARVLELIREQLRLLSDSEI